MKKGRNLFCIYPDLLEMVQREGHYAAPRGQSVIEMEHPVGWSLEKPQEWALFIPGRKLNPFFALAEVVWMWSGKGGADFIKFYNKSITNFLDAGIPYFHGSYGRRVRHAGYNESPFREIPHNRTVGIQSSEVEIDQLQYVISKILQDHDTRQAVVSLWDPVKDNLVQSKDHPCNNLLYFWVRKGRLNMTVVRRSNDLIWGVPYNMIQMSHLQALMAGSLQVEVGDYHVTANNLHYYKNLYPETLDTVEGWVSKGADLDKLSDTFYGKGWDMRWALQEFDNFVSKYWDPFEKQSRNFLTNQMLTIYENAKSNDHAARTVSAFYNTCIMNMDQAFSEYEVPEYWCNLFRMLLIYHCRKARALDLADALLSQMPRAMQWLANDFLKKESV